MYHQRYAAHLRHRVDDEKERQLAVAARGQLPELGQAPRLVQRQAPHVAAARQGAVHAAPQLLEGVEPDLARIQLPCTPTPSAAQSKTEHRLDALLYTFVMNIAMHHQLALIDTP